MTKQAQLADGTILEFPDETSDAVMDRAVRDHLRTAPPPSPARPAPSPSLDWSRLRPTPEGLAVTRSMGWDAETIRSGTERPAPRENSRRSPDFGRPTGAAPPKSSPIRITSFTSADRAPTPRRHPNFGPPGDSPPPPPVPTFRQNIERGLMALGTTLDLVPYGVERGLKGIFGEAPIDRINDFSTRHLGTAEDGARGVLANDVNLLNTHHSDPTLEQAGIRYQMSPDFFTGAEQFGRTILSNPASIPHILAEAAPSFVAGGFTSKAAQVAAKPVLENVAIRIGAQAAARGRLAVTGAGLNTGITLAHAGDNVAARSAEGVDVDEAARLGAVQTLAQIPPSALAGALLPVAPFKGPVGELGNVGVQALLQGSGNLASVIAGNAAIGRETSQAEGAAAFGGQALFAPIDVGIRLNAGRAARAERMAADFEARRAAADIAAERQAAEVHGAFSEEPVQTSSGWAHTSDGIIAGGDGNPVAFRSPRAAATFAAQHDLGGDHEIGVWGADSQRAVLRRRAPAGTAEAPPAKAEAPPRPSFERQEPAPSPPQPQPEPAPKPVAEPSREIRPNPGPLQAGEAYVTTPAGNKVRTRFEVVEAGALRPAEGELQNRDRTRGSTDLQIQEIVSGFDPTRLGDAPESDRGAPIVGPDDVIESGNGRVMSLNRIYDGHPEKAAAYRAFIESQGHSTEGIERPVLIRRRTSEFTPEQRRQFVIDSNKDAKLSMTATETARSDADALDSGTLALFRGGDLTKAENASFVQAFQKRLPASELAGLVDGRNQLSQAGIKRVENALMARAYENPDLLEKLLETRDSNIRSIGSALLDTSAAWARLRADVKEGRVKPEFDVTERLVEAARIVSDARTKGTKIGDLLAQGGMFGNIDPTTEQFVRAFYDAGLSRAVGRDAIGNVLAAYVRRASEQTTAARLFTAPDVAPAELLKTLLADRDGSGTGNLFGPAPPTPSFTRRPPPPESVAAEDRAPARPKASRRGGAAAEFSGVSGAVARDASAEPAQRSPVAKLRDEDLEPSEAEPDAKAYEVGRHLQDAGPYDPQFANESFTSRTSIYDTAAVAAGVDPDKFRLLPGPRQIALLKRVIFETFGLDVDVKAGMQDRFAIDQMLDAYQNVQGMAHVLGIPAKGISLGGRLRLALQKRARFLGSYEFGNDRIVLPGRSNSFAHEWGHALDWHLLRKLGDGKGHGFSGAIRQRGEGMQDGKLAPSRNVRESFIDLLNVMFFDRASLAARILELEAKIAATKAPSQKARFQTQIDNIKAGSAQWKGGRTGFYKGAQQFDGPGGDYWTSPTEMLARSFEAYVSHRAELAGFSTEFIGKGDAAYLSTADERFAKTFPKGTERDLIFAAYDVLFQRLAAEEQLGRGVAVPERPVTSTRSDLVQEPQLPDGGWFQRMLANEMGAFEDFFIRRAKVASNRPDNPRTVLHSAQDVVSYFAYGLTARMKMIGRRHRSPTIRLLHDMLTHNTGEGKFTPRGLLQATELRVNNYVNTIDRILEQHGMPRKGGVRKELNIEEAKTLRDLLISENVPDAPANLVKLGAGLRRLSDSIFYDLQRAGIDVGYTRNGHLARMLDLPKVEADNAGFLERAVKVYEIVFEQRFGEPNDVLGDSERLTDFLRLARQLAKTHPGIETGPVVALLRQIKRLDDSMAGADDPAAILGKIDKLTAELEEIFPELYDPVKAAFAKQSSEDWLLRIKTVAPDEFDKRGPGHDFAKKRTLPPEADKLLEDYYINDPVEVMATYATQAARRIEYASRFGQDNVKLRKMYEKMAGEGVPSQAIEDIDRIVTIVTGRQANKLTPAVNSFVSAIQTVYGTVALLPRAVFSSMAESLTAGIIMGGPQHGVKAFISLVEGALGTATAKERREVARFMGIVQAYGGHEILLNRFGGTYGDMTRWDRVSAKMFYKSGLIALTRAQRTHLIAPAHAFLDGLAGRVLAGMKARKAGGNGEPDTKSRAHKDMLEALARMRELGIRDPELFAREIRATNRLPSVDEMAAAMDGKNPYAYDWVTAVSRMVDQIIQNPTLMDRPEAAAGGWMGRLAYGIQAFNYAFWRNVIKGSAVRTIEQAKRGGAGYAAEKAVFGLLPSFALLMLGQFIFSTLREYLTNRARWEERKKKGTLEEELIWLGITRTFGLPIDPLVQGLTGLKYQRDLTAVPLGPALGNIAASLQQIATPAVRNSPKTNTTEYNALKGAYRLGIAPWAGAALSASPGGPLIGGLTGVATGYVTSPVAGDEFAAMFVGEKGSDTREKKGRSGDRDSDRETSKRGKED